MIIFGKIFGVKGVLFAGPFADGLAFFISSILLIIEIKNLLKGNIKSDAIPDDTSTDNKLNKQVVITVSREYGSGGRYIGRLIADNLGIKLYDKEFIEKLAKETGLSEEYIESNEQKRNPLAILNNGYYSSLSNADELFVEESKLIKEVADKESCVIIGRCADFILQDRKNVIKVFINGNKENKIKRATEIYGLDKEKAEKEIKRIDKQRANHYKYYTNREWSNSENYDICINSDYLGVEKTAEIICEMVKEKVVDF
jgi:cytidylate kinase